METQELIAVLENAFGMNSRIQNNAIRKAYNFSKQILNDSNDIKILKILPLLDSNHIYVKYWGAVIALSYRLLEERAIKEIIYILDINPKEFDSPLDLNLLKMDAGAILYDYKKNGVVGSFPGHNDNYKISLLPNFDRVVRYYKRKYKL